MCTIALGVLRVQGEKSQTLTSLWLWKKPHFQQATRHALCYAGASTLGRMGGCCSGLRGAEQLRRVPWEGRQRAGMCEMNRACRSVGGSPVNFSTWRLPCRHTSALACHAPLVSHTASSAHFRSDNTCTQLRQLAVSLALPCCAICGLPHAPL